MTRTEQIAVSQWLRSRRDDYLAIAKRQASLPKAYAFIIAAQAFDVAAKDIPYQFANDFPDLS